MRTNADLRRKDWAIEYFVDRILPGGQIEICLFGGEPMLNWDLGKKVVRQFGRRP